MQVKYPLGGDITLLLSHPELVMEQLVGYTCDSAGGSKNFTIPISCCDL